MSKDAAQLVAREFAFQLGKILGSESLTIGLAVSGGSDSMSLLHLAHDWAKDHPNVTLKCVTVDHGLRTEAADEAKHVSKICAGLGIPHDTLHWTDWDRSGNLQAEARAARRRLIAEWAEDSEIETILLGHTEDDLAETFLMRLARGSGVDGLSAMAPKFESTGIHWLRPLLTIARGDLRAFLTQCDVEWIDDPSNEDTRFERVKIRQALPALAEFGITSERLAQTAHQLGQARTALEHFTQECATKLATVSETGSVHIQKNGFLEDHSREVQNRLLSHTLKWVSDNEYRPRLDALEQAYDDIVQGKTHSLHGCLIYADQEAITVTREANAMPCSTDAKTIYDGKWRIDGGTWRDGYDIRPLTQKGLNQCEDWRDLARSRVELLPTPAIWHKTDLIAAPLAGKANGWRVTLMRGVHDFLTSIVTH